MQAWACSVHTGMRRFVSYFLATNAAQVVVIFAFVCAGLPIPLEPMQILFVNLVTDDLSAMAISIEPGEEDVMSFPPRNPKVRRAALFWLSRVPCADEGAHAVSAGSAAVGPPSGDDRHPLDRAGAGAVHLILHRRLPALRPPHHERRFPHGPAARRGTSVLCVSVHVADICGRGR
jgi:hypothetical protein